MNKYEKQILRMRTIRDTAIINEIAIVFDSIRDKSHKLAMDITTKAEGKENYFASVGKNEAFAKELNSTLRPDYLKKDNFSKNIYAEDYRTAYFESLYTITNEGIAEGYLVQLPRYTKQQFQQAINYPLSKLMNKAKMKTGRSVDLEQLYTSIVSGVEQGLSLSNIRKDLDIKLGYRDSQTGRLIKDFTDRKGQQYKTMRVLRTEVLRMRSVAETDQWLNQQDIVPSELVLIEVRDDRTRAQSARMDGQVANKEGKFKFPNVDEPKFAHRSGVAAYDIHDRATTINRDPEFPPESIIERDPVTQKNKVVPFRSFEDYAKDKGLTTNRYGEVLFK